MRGGNTVNNITNVNNINTVNRGNNWGSGGWFGGGGNYGRGSWGYGGSYGGWGGRGWGGGYYPPPAYGGGYYGNWYNGSWSHNNWGGFWSGFGIGAVTGWGLNALYNPAYAYNYGVSSYVPSWGAYNYTTWGLGGVSNGWLYSGYVNPYVTPQTQTIIVQQPVVVAADAPVQQDAAPATAQTVAFDYGNPIAASAAPPEPTAVDTAQQTFGAARDSFKAGDYQTALAKTDQALAQTPNDSILHEFRALVLFALERYDDAATTCYAVLTAGPGWNWTTMVGLYPNVDTYTAQLRALESYAKSNPRSAQPQFLLGYHYMVQGHKDAAAARFQEVMRLEPRDKLSAQLARALGATLPESPGLPPALAQAAQESGAQTTDLAQTGSAESSAADDQAADKIPMPPAPPRNLQGDWQAKPDPKTTIALSLKPEGNFVWTVTQDGKSQALEGWAGYQDGVLTLAQEQGAPLVGKLTIDPSGKAFAFKPPGAPQSVAGLTFEKSDAAAAPPAGTGS